MLVIGGPSAWKVRESKGWVIAWHWIARSGEDEEPTMVLRPARWHGRNPQGCAPYCLQLSQASALMERNGYQGIKLAEAAMNCCVATGTFPDRSTLFALRDIILDNLIDLIHMPPREMFKDRELDASFGAPNVGEMVFKVDGKVVAARDVKALEVGD